MSAGRILVVDDEPQIRRIMRTTLTGAGYEVDDAKTGEEALDKLRDFRPELVLLDINMPGMGGLAACRAIRADPKCCDHHVDGSQHGSSQGRGAGRRCGRLRDQAVQHAGAPCPHPGRTPERTACRSLRRVAFASAI